MDKKTTYYDKETYFSTVLDRENGKKLRALGPMLEGTIHGFMRKAIINAIKEIEQKHPDTVKQIYLHFNIEYSNEGNKNEKR